jgi:hypothetical protein
MAVAGILSSLDPKHETVASKLHVDEYHEQYSHSDVSAEGEKKEKKSFWNKTRENKERERAREREREREREGPREREKAEEELTRMIGAS